MHSSNGPVERAIQTMTNLVLANEGDGNNLTESVNRALTVMRITIHTGLKKTPIELHHGWKPRTEQTKFIKDEEFFYQIDRDCPFQHQTNRQYRYTSVMTPKVKSPSIW